MSTIPRAPTWAPTQLRPVNDFASGASPFGVLQMVGNVWEFVDQLRAPSAEALKSYPKLKPPPRADEPWYMIRGQSCGEPLLDTVIWNPPRSRRGGKTFISDFAA